MAEYLEKNIPRIRHTTEILKRDQEDEDVNIATLIPRQLISSNGDTKIIRYHIIENIVYLNDN